MSAQPNNIMQAPIPFSQEAEEALLGGLLLAPNKLSNIREYLKADDFMLTRHAYVWTALVNLQERAEPIDYLTVSHELKVMNILDDIGGEAFLTYLVNKTPTSVHVEAYGLLVFRVSTRRGLLEATDEMRKLAFDEKIDTPLMMANAHELLQVLDDRERRHWSLSAREVASSVFDELEKSIELYNHRKDYMRGVSTGFGAFDFLTDGILPAYITILAAETGLGKTAWILNVIRNATQRGIRQEEERPAHVVVFSGEMTEQDLARRMLSMMTGVDTRRITRGMFDRNNPRDMEAFKLVREATAEFYNLPLHFETGQRCNIAGLDRVIRDRLAKKELDLLVLDGILQVDTRDTQYKQDQDWLRIDHIMNELEAIAQTYRIPILATAQINRNGYDGEPGLQHLKRSSAIEEKSALIAMLYKPKESDGINNPIIRCKLAKNRFGQQGYVDFTYKANVGQFIESGT